MSKSRPPYDYYNLLLQSDTVINERLEKSSYIRFAGKFATRQAESKRNESYTEYFNNYKNNMKKSIIITAILLTGAIATKAQTAPPKTEQPIYVKMLPSQLQGLQQLLAFSFEWLPKSQAPSVNVEAAKSAIQTLYLVLVADSVKSKLPAVKK